MVARDPYLGIMTLLFVDLTDQWSTDHRPKCSEINRLKITCTAEHIYNTRKYPQVLISCIHDIFIPFNWCTGLLRTADSCETHHNGLKSQAVGIIDAINHWLCSDDSRCL